MTALKAHEVERYLARPDLTAGVFVVYGPDQGLVREISRRLIEYYSNTGSSQGQNGTLDFTILDMAQIEAEPARLSTEAKTSSLFGGANVIRVRNATKSIVASIEELLNEMPPAIIVVEAGNLLPRDKLRFLCERSRDARTLPCFADNANTLKSLIAKTFSDQEIQLDDDVVGLLIETLGNDREVTRRELEKLSLYAAQSKRITSDDIVALCGDNSTIATDKILDACGTGHAPNLESALNQAFAAAIDTQRILISAQNHFLWLRQGRERVEQGNSISEAMNKAQPRAHFSRRGVLEQQLRLWSEASLAKASERIAQAVLLSRQQTGLAESVARRALLAICMAAAHR